ncbi:Fe-S oxidoreductase [Desulfonema ishimotonii]|uniref:Fe-S oxidoreductase n=1 Tax=Desulfonema ishimotonii TaxID=45657 RepID=A0A401FQF7_9BACT|nr:YkgJ family cysteine cluster protein [Desulfonema ishimotonii]GBC59216.1 Fe-S oxidoreductase [Desulfonema ishimotonii]
MENQMIPIDMDESFEFSCGPDVPCFNECCRDLNQFLTPYDILRLKNHLGMRAEAFLDRYTTQHTGPETGLPVVVLRQNPDADFKCPFVAPEGCRVYEARPASCRTYPLARLASRSRETGQISEYYALMKEPHCQGFGQQKTQTVREWIRSQGIEIYNEMNDRFMEIIAMKNKQHPGPLDIKERHIFHLGCYDLDNFRSQVFEKGLPARVNVLPELAEQAKTDDLPLLKIGYQWVQDALFGTD